MAARYSRRAIPPLQLNPSENLRVKLPSLGRKQDLHKQIRRHYDQYWGAARIEEVHWTPGPIATRAAALARFEKMTVVFEPPPAT
jgi:hypothetical protein